MGPHSARRGRLFVDAVDLDQPGRLFEAQAAPFDGLNPQAAIGPQQYGVAHDRAKVLDHVAVHRGWRWVVALGVLGLALHVGHQAPAADRVGHRLGVDVLKRCGGADERDQGGEPALDVRRVAAVLADVIPPATAGLVDRQVFGGPETAFADLTPLALFRRFGGASRSLSRRSVKPTTFNDEIELPEAAVFRLVDGHGVACSSVR